MTTRTPRKTASPLADPKPGALVQIDAIDEAIVAFHVAFRNVVDGADEKLAEQGMGRTHHKILFHTARHPCCPVSEVRDFIGVSRQALQRPLNDLHRAGLVQTLVSPENRRIHQLVLTPAGLALEQQITALVRVHFQAAFKAVGASSRAQWLAVMQALGTV
ncbi:MarR family winged helix-turn-helix transcriptional regulator [Variovorax sp. Root411]|uniref:MarR family winged helix-turn-helix transcriptional regulator n=1 Tax=Variovorax sp. Root411 TaxID=1736530 RepID=UPI0006F5F30E|nr:MarR family winged helix-turn-helix transcriptional regulator [Variovorax sp. Root411]KQW54449.1 hypothetical protein ASC92_20740 [Variovorax sp. Root411]